MDFDKINIDAVSYNVKDTTARQQISDEITARKQADTQLSQQISAETTAREQADSQIKQEIEDEIAASALLVTAADNVTTVHGDTINLASTVKTFVGSAVTWLENIHRRASEAIASFVSKSDSGNYGAVFASRNSDNNADEAMSAIGIGGFGISDNTNKPKPAWGGYFEGRKIGQSGPAFGLEIDTGAWGNKPLEVTPYSAVNAYTGQNAIVAGINLSAGLGYADGNSPYQLTPYGSSAALWIHANPKKFKQGIVFQDGAVDDSCIIMPWTGKISWSREDVFNSPNVAYLTATGHCLSDWSDTNFPFLSFNRQTANGGPIPDGSIIGQVGAGGRLYNLPCRIDFKKISGNKYQLIFYTGKNSITFYDEFIFPQNATISVGTANNRFSTAYLVSDVNVSSDKRLKQDVSEIPENLQSALRALKPKQYKLEDGKTHFGYVAQDVVAAIESAGYDPLKTGIVDKDDKGFLSLRYTELLCAMM